jgi:hypothetical protein
MAANRSSCRLLAAGMICPRPALLRDPETIRAAIH